MQQSSFRKSGTGSTPSAQLRSLLILCLIGSNILLFTLAGSALYQSYQQEESEARTVTQNIAGAVDQDVSNSIGKIDLALHTVADELEYQLAGNGVDELAMNVYLARLEQRLPEIEACRVTNASGTVILGKGLHKKEAADIADRAYFIYLRDHADGTLRITKPLMGRIAKRYMVIFARRYNHPDGGFAGVVFASIPLGHFDRMLARFALGRGAAIVLRDADLGLVSRFPAIPQQPGGKVGSTTVSEELRRMTRSGVATATYEARVNSDGIQRTITFRRLSKAPMFVLVGLAQEDYLAAWVADSYKTLAMASGFLVLSALLGRMFLRLLAKADDRENMLRQSKQRLLMAQEGANIGIWEADLVNDTAYWSPECERLYGLAPGTLKHVDDWRAMVHPDDLILIDAQWEGRIARMEPFEVEYRIPRDSGEPRWILSKGQAHYDGAGKPVRLSGINMDITERKHSEEQVRNLAFYDPLTRLPNRRLLRDRLQHAITGANRHRRYGALLLLDMDDFKVLNATLGHDIGDKFLVEVASRLRTCVREGDTAARQGGDEFAVILEDLGDDTLAVMKSEKVATKILHAISQPYLLDVVDSEGKQQKRGYHCTVSIGVTLYCDNSISVDELMKRADAAMYQAKGAGRNTLRFFDQEMQAAVIARAALSNDLREAMRENQFLLHYQPQVDSMGCVTGAEALIRWRHPECGMVSPAEFIPLAEATGLIQPIGQWVLETVCAKLVAWSVKPEMSHLTVAVNVSAHQFHHPDFVNKVLAVLERSGADPTKLKLELTESMLLQNVEDIVVKMTALKAHGIGFSLDDFGTGYSSLSYLRRLPLDQLKIDQSFVRDVLTSANAAAIAGTIVALAQNMGLAVIAEGVETDAQRAFLAANGCEAYQGYLFSRPLSIEQFEQLVRLA